MHFQRSTERFPYAKNNSIEQMIDLCGMDYSEYAGGGFAHRFAVVLHLLSVTHNQRLRVRVFATNDDFPVLPSITNSTSCGAVASALVMVRRIFLSSSVR